MKKQDKAADRTPATRAKPATEYWPRIESFLQRRATLLSAALVLLATIRIVSTYTVFSHTFDEPAHLACGMEWLDKHTYNYEPQHPPLARIMTALLPRIFGARSLHQKSMWDEGLAILFRQGSEDFTLALARVGVLPFFWIACWIAFVCTRWISGSDAAAVIAVFLVTMTPSVLAHAGLATTDMGLTAMLLLAVYSLWRWSDEPNWPRAAILGVSTGLAMLSKFSALPFLPAIALIGVLLWLCLDRPWARLPELIRERAFQLVLAVALASIVVWAGYLFSFGRTPALSFSVPAPEFFDGIQEVQKHNTTGHLTYLMGAVNTVGWPYFYLVALGVKTPVPILVLGIPGLALLFSRKLYGSRGWIAPSIVLGILVFSSFFTRIKIGTRHVLPVFGALAIAGGCLVVRWMPLLKERWAARTTLGLMLAWVAVTSLAAHPDYLAYFNLFAGSKPEAYLVDSDLDWGQDIKRLATRLKELGAAEVYFNQFGPGNLEKEYGFPKIRPLDVNGPLPGWSAVNITPMKLGLFGDARYAHDTDFQFWPDVQQPEERVGSGILLFYRAAGAR